jgi:hydroxymethylglutaryl-CoA lyase
MADRVKIVEVGPRDGLQSEARIVATAQKVGLIDALSLTGLETIEVASFVSPKWVPQMADGAQVLASIKRRPGVRYSALVPNLKGYARARAAAADEVAVFISASEGFSLKNINCTIAESLERVRGIAAAARADGVPVRGYVSCVVACPYDGATSPDAVARLAAELLALGCYEVSLGDTIGAGEPASVSTMLEAVLREAPAQALAGHFHDTGGRALSNLGASLEMGLRVFDASVGGLGGCPFAPGAPGNVATGAVVDHLAARGLETGIDVQRLDEAARLALAIRGLPR